jgi:glycosyltransferase involved in cell wall biosynthesis
VSATLDIAIPVNQMQKELGASVRRLHRFLQDELPFTTSITIADGASTDGTWLLAVALAGELPNVRALRLNERGRGRALAAAWLTSDARVVAHVDADLHGNLSTLPALVAPIMSGNCDLSIGYMRAATDGPSPRSRHLLWRIAFGAELSDARLRSKAIRAGVARRLLPRVRNRNWLFDAELLAEAQRAGLRINQLDGPEGRHPTAAPARHPYDLTTPAA